MVWTTMIYAEYGSKRRPAKFDGHPSLTAFERGYVYGSTVQHLLVRFDWRQLFSILCALNLRQPPRTPASREHHSFLATEVWIWPRVIFDDSAAIVRFSRSWLTYASQRLLIGPFDSLLRGLHSSPQMV